MCRLVVYCGHPLLMADLITRPEHSVIHQSYDCRERKENTNSLPSRLNADGFGIGWYAPEVSVTPCVFTSTLPAWNNRNLFRICEKISTPLLFAHVRAAGTGNVTESNCHPFAVGRYMFMHNGHIDKFSQLKRGIIMSLGEAAFQSIEGTTDSEHAFAVFLDELNQPFDEGVEPMKLLEVMVSTIHRIRNLRIASGIKGHSYLNFAVTDGDSSVISRVIDDDSNTVRAASMYFSSGTSFKQLDDGTFRMAQRDRREDVIIVASEKLTSQDEDWVEVPTNHIMLITPSLNVFIIKMDLQAGVPGGTQKLPTMLPSIASQTCSS